MADVYFLREDDKAVKRTPPHNVLVFLVAIPREYAVVIGGNETLRRQVASYGYKPVLLTIMRIGKYVGFVIEKSKKHLVIYNLPFTIYNFKAQSYVFFHG
jgi:hypothetical protein